MLSSFRPVLLASGCHFTVAIRHLCGVRRQLYFQEGDSASTSKTFSEDEVGAFAEISGDTNPLHIDAQYAAATRYGQRVVHGVLLTGLASSVLGTKLPGHGTVVMSLSCEFPKPAFIGEEITAEATVTEIKSLLVNCAITCRVPERDEIVMKGTASVLAPKSALRRKGTSEDGT